MVVGLVCQWASDHLVGELTMGASSVLSCSLPVPSMAITAELWPNPVRRIGHRLDCLCLEVCDSDTAGRRVVRWCLEAEADLERDAWRYVGGETAGRKRRVGRTLRKRASCQRIIGKEKNDV